MKNIDFLIELHSFLPSSHAILDLSCRSRLRYICVSDLALLYLCVESNLTIYTGQQLFLPLGWSTSSSIAFFLLKMAENNKVNHVVSVLQQAIEKIRNRASESGHATVNPTSTTIPSQSSTSGNPSTLPSASPQKF